ncbi:hypothetical protein EGM88_12675 [Aureibaculum marinum]|uniref:DUF6705 domain-containing protein n=1 Tax=Aureibaculum marinum TaxID=2487930 RepID=A0A3N4NCX8_9FLAO|nr:DUF6705 family protein [Aureibaculum marinum]RPD94041.1 hypothetical protein EGM88_12675 [Aureibaculum marinum]
MKNILIIIVSLSLTTLSCKAQQIIPVENAVNYRNSEGGLMGDKDYVYVKDVNNLLNKFVGTWQGIYDNKTFEFNVVKITEDDGELKEDKLIMRYKITDSESNVIEDVTSLPNDDTLVMNGGYIAKSGSYVFYYQGKNSDCGQNGDVFISVYGTNHTKMKLFLQVSGEIWSGADCPDTPIPQILPTEQMELIKQ